METLPDFIRARLRLLAGSKLLAQATPHHFAQAGGRVQSFPGGKSNEARRVAQI
jgi:hypothetical protein